MRTIYLISLLLCWTWSEGDITAFTDDPKRIPAAYRGIATQVEIGELKDYDRFTIDQTQGRAQDDGDDD